MKKKTKKPSKRALIKKLDTVFSLWVRNKHATSDGLVFCYTCLTRKPVKEMQCGHFISRAYFSTRWEPDNCRPQCVSCNIYHQGQQYIFGKNLEKELRIGRIAQMQKIKSQPARFSIQDYQDMILFFSVQPAVNY